VLLVTSVAIDVSVSSVVSEDDSDPIVVETDEAAGASATTCNKLIESIFITSATLHFCTITTFLF